MMVGNPFAIPEEWVNELTPQLTPEEQAAAASRLASEFFAMTGQPLPVHPSQMKTFREAGVDCTHLLEVGQLPE